MVIHRRAGGLHHEDVGAAHVLLNLDVVLAVGETLHLRYRQIEPQVLTNLLGQGGVGVPAENLDSVWIHPAYRLWGGHWFSLVCDRSRLHHSERYFAWLTSVMGNTRSSRNASLNDGSARWTCSRPWNSPKTAEPLPLIMAGRAPNFSRRRLIDFSAGCCLKTRLSKSFSPEVEMPSPAPRAPHCQAWDWKLTILFCCDSDVNSALSRR